jgi:type I restriction enzyme M protein
MNNAIVQKLWNYCNILRDDLSACGHAQAGGLSYLLARRAQASGDYPPAWLTTGVEQLTFLLFLKMADEQSRAPFNKPSPVPKNVDWQSLLRLDGDELETRSRHVLESLGKQHGMVGDGELGKWCQREQNAHERREVNLGDSGGYSPPGERGIFTGRF